MLLAVVDDGIGLIIIAVYYGDKSKPPELGWLGLLLLAVVVSFALRKFKVKRWEIYVAVAGPIAWFGLLLSSMHPALALVFVVPFMPLHNEGESGDPGHGHDGKHEYVTLHAFGADLKPFVDCFVLFFFGLANAGVQMKNVGGITAAIIISLIVGKTLGVGFMSMLGSKIGFPLPTGMGTKEGFMVGFIASIGLTVALFVSGEAFPDKLVLQGEAKMGALLSVLVAAVAIFLSKTVCTFTKPELSDEEEATMMNIDIDEEEDDERMDDIIVKEMQETIKKVSSSVKMVEAQTGQSRKDYHDMVKKESLQNFFDIEQ